MKVDQQCWGQKGLSKEKGPLLLLSKRFQTFGLFVMLDDEISQIRRLPPPKAAHMMNSRNPHSPVRNMKTRRLSHNKHCKQKRSSSEFSLRAPLSPLPPWLEIFCETSNYQSRLGLNSSRFHFNYRSHLDLNSREEEVSSDFLLRNRMGVKLNRDPRPREVSSQLHN